MRSKTLYLLRNESNNKDDLNILSWLPDEHHGTKHRLELGSSLFSSLSSWREQEVHSYRPAGRLASDNRQK